MNFRAALSLLGLVVAAGYVAENLPEIKSATTMLVETFSQADEPRPIVVLDSWWSGDYAVTGCEQAKEFMKRQSSSINQIGCDAVTGCSDEMPRYTACQVALNGPAAVAHGFEDELMTQFVINTTCKGVTFARYYGPTAEASAEGLAVMSKPQRWTLIVDFTLGNPMQPWSLQDQVHGFYHQAAGDTPTKIAVDVCAIVMGHGGTMIK